MVSSSSSSFLWQTLVFTHVSSSTVLMALSLFNYVALNPSMTKLVALVAIPSTIPILPLTLHRWPMMTSRAGKILLGSLTAGGALLLGLSVDTLRRGHNVPLNMLIGPMRLETAAFVSCIGALVLNGKRFVPRFKLQNTFIGKVWLKLSANPPVAIGLAEAVGAAMLIVERLRTPAA